MKITLIILFILNNINIFAFDCCCCKSMIAQYRKNTQKAIVDNVLVPTSSNLVSATNSVSNQICLIKNRVDEYQEKCNNSLNFNTIEYKEATEFALSTILNNQNIEVKNERNLYLNEDNFYKYNLSRDKEELYHLEKTFKLKCEFIDKKVLAIKHQILKNELLFLKVQKKLSKKVETDFKWTF